MPDEVVLDASVAAKAFITEPGSDVARALIASNTRTVAPDFVLAELANVAVKRFRRGDISRAVAEDMVAMSRNAFDETISAEPLTVRAFALAADCGLSTYDALYVALAELRACDLVTADARLIAAVQRAGLDIVIREP
jgi:predicted nucleic acid-binding protein